MKITETIYKRSKCEYGDDDYGVTVEIVLNDGSKHWVGFYEGEPEDFLMYRDLKYAYDIAAMVKASYDAGKRGEPMVFESMEHVDEN